MANSKNTTKKQHYVWRGYLKRWTNDDNTSGRVYTFRKRPKGDQQEYQYACLENVGFQKYYYDMTGFSDDDVKIVSHLILYMQKNKKIKFDINTDLEAAKKERDYIEGLMCKYENIENTNHFIEKIIAGDMTFYADSAVQKAANIAREEMGNTLVGGNRSYSDKDLWEITLDAIIHLDDDTKYEFLRFLFMQQQRSPRVHDVQLEIIEEFKNNNPQFQYMKSDYYVNTIMIYFAEQIALNVSMNFHTWLERLDNKTDVPFITCDCPVVNLTGDEIGESHEFYFPLSPQIAVKMCSAYKESKNGNVANKSVDVSDEETVIRLNQIIAQEAYKEVFSNDEDTLRDVCERLKQEYV